MKNISLALLFVASLAVSSCHYGQDEAQKTLERNDLYKGDKAEYSVNRAGEGASGVSETPAEAPGEGKTEAAASATDSAAKAPEAKAEGHAAPAHH